jgi:hypothetical protein
MHRTYAQQKINDVPDVTISASGQVFEVREAMRPLVRALRAARHLFTSRQSPLLSLSLSLSRFVVCFECLFTITNAPTHAGDIRAANRRTADPADLGRLRLAAAHHHHQV